MNKNYRLALSNDPLNQYNTYGLHNGRIKIKDENQFVPLLLAGIFGDAPKAYSTPNFSLKNIRIGNSDYRELNKLSPFNSSVGNNIETQQIFVKTTKEVIAVTLNELLNSDMPTEYTLTSYSYNSGADANSVLHGRYIETTLLQPSNDHVFGLGFIATYKQYAQNQVSSMATSLYPSQLYHIPQNVTDIIKPVVLTLIKAKHLKYVRAKLFTKQPLNLPISDMKIVRTPTSGGNSYYNAWQGQLFGKLVEQGVVSEFLSSEQISQYLFNPVPTKTNEQVLKDAIAEMESPTCMLA